MKNRYGKQLRDYNKEILALNPASETLRLVMAFEFKKLYRTDDKVLEIGCGEGDSAKLLLHYTQAKMDLLDISPQMILSCKKNLSAYKKRLHYICSDALSYLRKSEPYKIILSSWTIHNFQQKDKKELLATIHAKLLSGGAFIFMDKVYPDTGGKALLDNQLKRYSYLSAHACREIVAHEKTDYADKFRMNEGVLLKILKGVGFSKISVIDRVERDIVLIAYK